MQETEEAGGPSGHLGWAFRGTSQFEARATRFLAEGVERGERLVFVTDDPNPARWPAWLVRRGTLQVVSNAEVYGPDLLADAVRQRASFAGVLERALSEGYSGLRVMADNTALVASPDRLEAWLEWEALGDAFMAAHPVTGLCGFDATRLDAGTLAAVLAPHGRLLEG